MTSHSSGKKLLLVGASRGLGLALAEEYLKRGWEVVATQRDSRSSGLPDLARTHTGRLKIERVDINHPDQVDALRARLAERQFDMLFVNAGVTTANHETAAEVSTEEFVRVMVTNALSPIRVIEALQGVADTMDAQAGKPGLRYLDCLGREIPW